MITHNLTLPLPAHLIAALRRLADDREINFDRLVRGMLEREVMRFRSAQASQRAEHDRVARLYGLLKPVMEAARGWGELQARLALFGFALQPDGPGIALHDRSTGEWLCRGADLGLAYPLLMRRFGGPLQAPEPHVDPKMPIAFEPAPVDGVSVA